MEFFKISAQGNDFIIFEGSFFCLSKDMIISLCQDRGGLAADGVLVLLVDKSKDKVRLKIYNKDATEPNFCGNGLICTGLYMKEVHNKENITVELPDSSITSLKVENNKVKVKIPQYDCLKLHHKIYINNTQYIVHLVRVGVPHAVLFFPNIGEIDVYNLGSQIRHMDLFEGEDGTNVDFVSLREDGIFMRTYERGVEGETLSCGSGATASAIITSIIHKKDLPIKVFTKKALLTIHKIGAEFYLEGQCSIVCQGRLFYQSLGLGSKVSLNAIHFSDFFAADV